MGPPFSAARDSDPQCTSSMVGGLGFEPRSAGSEPAVLPVDDPPAKRGRAKYRSVPALSRRLGLRRNGRRRRSAGEDEHANFASPRLLKILASQFSSFGIFDVHRADVRLAVQRPAGELPRRIGAPVELHGLVPGLRQPIAVLVDLHRAVREDEAPRLEPLPRAGGRGRRQQEREGNRSHLILSSAASIRRSVRALPSSAMVSKRGGLTVVPVSATRTGCASLPSPRPRCSARARKACSIACGPCSNVRSMTARASSSSGRVSIVSCFATAFSSYAGRSGTMYARYASRISFRFRARSCIKAANSGETPAIFAISAGGVSL